MVAVMSKPWHEEAAEWLTKSLPDDWNLVCWALSAALAERELLVSMVEEVANEDYHKVVAKLAAAEARLRELCDPPLWPAMNPVDRRDLLQLAKQAARIGDAIGDAEGYARGRAEGRETEARAVAFVHELLDALRESGGYDPKLIARAIDSTGPNPVDAAYARGRAEAHEEAARALLDHATSWGSYEKEKYLTEAAEIVRARAAAGGKQP